MAVLAADQRGPEAQAGQGVATHCPYCALQCGTTLVPDSDSGVRVVPRDFPTNRGGLCRKGWTAPAVLTAPDRLATPLVRRDGELVAASWDEALDTVAAAIRRAQAAGGQDAVAVFGGGGLTNEKAYQLGKFARVALGTSQIDYNGRFCMSSATTGFDEVRRAVASWWPERVERVSGVGAAALRRAATLLAGAHRRGEGVYVLTGRGVEQHTTGTATVSAFIDLALALGLPGTPGSGYGCVTGQGNGQGGREHGQKADQLPGYRRIDDPAAREYVAGVWGVEPESLPGPGRSAYELLDALGTPAGPRALLIFGSNPVVSAPHAGHVTDRLAALDLLVVADLVPSETTELADVVLPVTQWAEEEGTMTSLEGRVLRRRRALDPPPGVRTDHDVLAGLAIRLGQPAQRFPTDPREIYDELRAASAGGAADYAGISYERLDAGEALHWPCPDLTHPGTPRLFTERFAHPDGRARFVPTEHTGAAERVSARFPLRGTTGRVLAHYQSGAQTRRVPELDAAEPEVFVEVHPDTAAAAGLPDGATARLVTDRGAMRAVVRTDDTLRPDTVFLPFHYAGEQRANLLTNPALDPVSRMPEFKVCAVRLEPDPAQVPA